MNERHSFYLQKGNVYALPVLHYNMEIAAEACKLFHHLKPACVAVELAETLSLQLQHAVSRLPDISLVSTETSKGSILYYLVEPCDAGFEALRCAQEANVPAFCIDLDLDDYPQVREPFPDPYAIKKIGYKKYYELYVRSIRHKASLYTPQDQMRELHMAKKLKELSLRYDSVFFIGGLFHVQRILDALDLNSYPTHQSVERPFVHLTAPTEESSRHIMGEFGWISAHYERAREEFLKSSAFVFPPDRQRLILSLFKESGKLYKLNQGAPFAGYNLRNTMKFSRNYALLTNRLLPDLYQVLSAAKGCVDHNYAYEVWELATEYPHLKNVDSLPEEDLSAEDVWGHSKSIRFHLRMPGRKDFLEFPKRRDKSKTILYPPGPFSICSYQPEDVVIENFGKFLQKKAMQLQIEDSTRTVPFTASIEDGIDTRETIRHLMEKKLYVKASGKPPGGVGSVVVIFDEDSPKDEQKFAEKFSWHTTWIGEHNQESDMAFYATPTTDNVIGPGISRCEYGGFMMSYPPRRMQDVWSDSDYGVCRSKSEILLVAAIDYSLKPVIVYVASKPPRSQIKSFAKRFGKKVIYIPIGQLSPVTLNKLRVFHVLDGHDKREIAGDYIW